MVVDLLVRDNISEKEKTLEKTLDKKLSLVASICLSNLSLKDKNLSILITNDEEIKSLNKEYRNKDKATDVLSFSMNEGEDSLLNSDLIVDLGDVVISLDTAKKQAKEFEVSLEDELTRLLIHGILHLAGYDHENVSEEEVRKMEEKEKELFLLAADS